jgi:two-component system chemotaxis response regulator CheY
LNTFFRHIGFKVRATKDSREALEILENESFDFLITDYNMPRMNGIELVKAVRAKGFILPVIGISSDNKKQEFIKYGANLFIQKPFGLTQVKEAVDRLTTHSNNL